MIYFARHIETGRIKIGCTGHVPSRLIDISSKFGTVKLIGFMYGDRSLESELHNQFRRFNVRGVPAGREWFLPDSALLNYITANCTQLGEKPAAEGDIISRFIELLADKEKRDGVRYTQKDIAEQAEVSPAVVSRWMKGDIAGANLVTVRKFCKFFHCGIGDLLVYVPDEDERELV